MKLLVALNAVPFIRGGAELLAERLVVELRAAGHEAELLRIPVGDTLEEMADATVAASLMTFDNVDRVIAMKFPAYLVPHNDVVVWLVHQVRQAYELRADAGGWPRDEHHLPLIEMITAADAAALGGARRVYAISPEVADRLRRFNGIGAEVLRHPPHGEFAYRCEPAERYLLALGRISSGKRQALAVRAMAHVPDGRLIVAGAPDTPADLAELEEAVVAAGVGDRVEIIGRFISEEEKLDLLARCTGGIYLPVDEDTYGYVCYEAAMSGKPTITCSDSGGALTLVDHGVTGLVADPAAPAVGAAIDRLLRDGSTAHAMGQAARAAAVALDLSWERVVTELTR